MKNDDNNIRIIKDVAQAWVDFNPELICKHLDTSFVYDSQWAMESLDCERYKEYITNKFKTLKQHNIKLDISIVDDNTLDGKMIAIKRMERLHTIV